MINPNMDHSFVSLEIYMCLIHMFNLQYFKFQKDVP